MDAKYCNYCTSLFASVNDQEPVWNSHRKQYWTRVPQYEQLCYYSFQEIEASASQGCPLCSKLHAWLAKHNTYTQYKGLDCIAEPNASAAGAWKFRFGMSDGDGEKRMNDDPSSLLTFTCHPLETADLRVGSPENMYHGFAPGDQSLHSTGSTESLARARLWLSKCLENHKQCSTDIDTFIYPPRLLDLRGGKVRLVGDTALMKTTPYAALSHSWGPNPQQLILTTDNQFMLGHSIEDAMLPATFRDAIVTTRALGLEYLWIDSLCIIQAGHAHVGDWLGHSAIMGSIYQNCTVNIAAAHGHDASAGCFASRDIAEIAPCIVNLRKVTSIGNAEEDDFTVTRADDATPYLLVPEPLLSENVAHFHLDTRAWVCQERLLSPRTIYFSKKQLFWECNSLQNTCETVPEGVPTSILPEPDEFPYMGEAIGQDFSWGTMQFDTKIPPYSWRSSDSKEQYDWWLKTLHGYVRRNLTKSSDKLPAIGGIAERTAKILDDEYLAGLFKKQLPDALLWSCVQERRPKQARSTDQFFAPSWSWASLNAELDFTPLAEENQRVLCTVQSSRIVPVDPANVYGQVKSAELRIKGPFLTFARAALNDDKNWIYHFAELHIKGLASKKQLLYFDFDPGTLDCEKLGLLVVRENARPYTYPGSGDMEEAGLVLAPCSVHEGKWIRIGVWKGVEWDFDEKRRHVYKNVSEVVLV